jgi:hypothetical protein
MFAINTAVDHRPDAQSDARRAVEEMVANGAQFTVTRREDGTPSFLWELRTGGNKSRCRALVADAKAQSALYWRSFLAAIVEQAGSHPP